MRSSMHPANLSLHSSSDPTQRSWLWPAALGVGLLALAWVLGERHAVNEIEEAIEDGDLVVPDGEDYEDDEPDDDIEDAEIVESEAAPVARYRARRR